MYVPKLKCIYCRQHIVGSFSFSSSSLLIYQATLCFLTGEFSPFTFPAIIGRHGLNIAILLIVSVCLGLPFFLSSSVHFLCDLMVSIMIFLDLFPFVYVLQVLLCGYYEPYMKHYSYSSVFKAGNNLTLNICKHSLFLHSPTCYIFDVTITYFYVVYTLTNYCIYSYF